MDEVMRTFMRFLVGTPRVVRFEALGKYGPMMADCEQCGKMLEHVRGVQLMMHLEYHHGLTGEAAQNAVEDIYHKIFLSRG